MFKLVKALTLFAGLSAVSIFAENNPVEFAIAHVPDQSNTKRNDPKWLNGNSTLGQSFVPQSNKISLLYAKIFAASEKNGKVKRLEKTGKDKLLFRLIELKNVNAVSESNPISPRAISIGKKDFFEINKDLAAGMDYYFEFYPLPESKTAFYFWFQYRGDPYPDGDIYMNGKKWIGSDLEFTSYYPVRLELKNNNIKKLPEIFEIHFAKKMDKNKVNVFISGPCGIVKGPKTWHGKKVIYLGPMELKDYSLPSVTHKLYISYLDEKNKKYKTVVIPFVCKK
jgi:hypothetical protein